MPKKKHNLNSILETFVHVHREHEKRGEIQTSCPFREHHADGSGKQSFWINPDKNVYKCWSCKSSGTLLGLLTTTFEIDYYDAVELIHYNPIDYLEAVPYEDRYKPTGAEHKKFVLEHPLSIRPPSWIANRYSPEIVKEMKIGSMVSSKGESITTFPVISSGELVGVAYRIDTPNGKIMWFNDNFNKEDYFYHEPKNESILCMVEGQTDTLQTYTNGTKNVSGIMGSYLTKPQIKHINRLDRVEECWLAFDNDNAGMLCTLISGELIESQTDKDVYVLPMEDDPGSCSKSQWKMAVNNRTPFAEYKVRMSILIPEDYEKNSKLAKKHIEKWHEN